VGERAGRRCEKLADFAPARRVRLTLRGSFAEKWTQIG